MRLPALQNFVDLTRQGLEAQIGSAPASAAVVREIFAKLDRVSGAKEAVVPTRLPTCDHLKPVLAQVEPGHELADLARVFASLEPNLAWKHRPGSEGQRGYFFENHANATIVGPGGLEAREDVWIGVSLMAPQTQYPDHTHAPEEVYLALSEGEWRQNQGPWHAPGRGGLVHNLPNVLHSMRSTASPLLAIWCLLAG